MDKHDDVRLFSVAPSYVHLVASYDWRTGWRLRVQVPTGEGPEAGTQVYEDLSTPELLDAASSALALVLGLERPPY